MGLILAPMALFWFMVSLYSLKIGYSLISNYSVTLHSKVLAFVTLTALFSYLYISALGFKNSEKLWVFDIPVFFMLNKISFAILVSALLLHWFGGTYLTSIYLKPIPFILIFTISVGAIVGAFSSDFIMTKYKITRTH